MTKKSRRESLRESLSEVVRPPDTNPKLDAILGKYASATPVLHELAPVEFTASTESVAPVENSGAVKYRGEPQQKTAAVNSIAPAESTGMRLVPATSPHLRVPNEIEDRIMPTLKPSTQAVLRRLYRLSAGFDLWTCHVSMPKLAQMANVSESQARLCVRELESKGLVKVIRVDLSSRDRGLEFEVMLPRITRSNSGAVVDSAGARNSGAARNSAPNKDKALKENNKKGINRLTPEGIKSFTATVVDLLAEGKSVEEVEGAYAPSMHPADWAAVKSVALAQGATKKGK